MEPLPNIFWMIIILFIFFTFSFIIYNPPPPIPQIPSNHLSPTTQSELNNPQQKTTENIAKTTNNFYSQKQLQSDLKKTK